MALDLPAPSYIDKDLREALVAFGTQKERLVRSYQEKLDREREAARQYKRWTDSYLRKLEQERADARRTPPAQERPDSGTASTSPALSRFPPMRERRRPVAAGDRASLIRKRRMRKSRTTEQKQKKSGATATAQVKSRGRGVNFTDLPVNKNTETPLLKPPQVPRNHP